MTWESSPFSLDPFPILQNSNTKETAKSQNHVFFSFHTSRSDCTSQPLSPNTRLLSHLYSLSLLSLLLLSDHFSVYLYKTFRFDPQETDICSKLIDPFCNFTHLNNRKTSPLVSASSYTMAQFSI